MQNWKELRMSRDPMIDPRPIVIPPATQARTTRTVTIKGDVKNAEVLAALKKITGQDFGYNKRAWEVWWQTQANS